LKKNVILTLNRVMLEIKKLKRFMDWKFFLAESPFRRLGILR
jgi:hypothetical protein